MSWIFHSFSVSLFSSPFFAFIAFHSKFIARWKSFHSAFVFHFGLRALRLLFYIYMCMCVLFQLIVLGFIHFILEQCKWQRTQSKMNKNQYKICNVYPSTRNTWHWCVLNVQHFIFYLFKLKPNENSNQVISNWNKCSFIARTMCYIFLFRQTKQTISHFTIHGY